MDSEPDPYAPRASSSYVYPDSSRASSSYDGRSSGRPSSASPNSDGAEARSETRASSGSAEDADVEEPLFGGDETGGSKRHNGQDPAAGTEQGNRGSADNADNKDALYALLNVPREASEDQIREAYRALAGEFALSHIQRVSLCCVLCTSLYGGFMLMCSDVNLAACEVSGSLVSHPDTSA